MTHTIDRRTFLRTSGVLFAGASLAGLDAAETVAAETMKLSTPSALKIGWPVAVQQYTFRRFSLYETLEIIAGMGVRHIEPAFFLALDSKRPQLKPGAALAPPLRREMRKRMSDHGISMPTYYANVTSDKNAAVKTFKFSKEMGASTIVAEPPPEAFDMIEELCDQYTINLAVHNHPKSPQSRYWKPENVLAVCEGRSKRIGACCDTGHWVRSALKPMECLKKMEGRIISFHLKDVGVWGKPQARDVPLGQGLADYTAILKELKRQGFQGVMAVEYEHDSPKLKEEVVECLAFVEKVASQLG